MTPYEEGLETPRPSTLIFNASNYFFANPSIWDQVRMIYKKSEEKVDFFLSSRSRKVERSELKGHAKKLSFFYASYLGGRPCSLAGRQFNIPNRPLSPWNDNIQQTF